MWAMRVLHKEQKNWSIIFLGLWVSVMAMMEPFLLLMYDIDSYNVREEWAGI
jgi:hypothetical protein